MKNTRRVTAAFVTVFRVLCLGLAGLFASGVLSAAQADAYLTPTVSCGSECYSGDPINFSFVDTLASYNGGSGTITPASAYQSVCYDLYLDDPLALSFATNRIYTFCSAAYGGQPSFYQHNDARFNGLDVPIDLPAGQHSFSVRRTWIPNLFFFITDNIQFDYVNTVYFEVKDRALLSVQSGSPQIVPVGQPFPLPLEVRVTNDAGQIMPNSPVTFTQRYTNGSLAMADLSSTTAMTNSEGIASVTATANGYRGLYAIDARGVGSRNAVTFSLRNSGPPARIEVIGGSDQTALLLTPFAQPLRVRVTDDEGFPITGTTVNFTAQPDPQNMSAVAVLSSATAVTDQNGVASITASANGYSGPHTVVASVAGLAQTASFALSNHGPGSRISVKGGSLQAAPLLSAFPAMLEVLVTDDVGQPASGVRVDFSTQSQPPNYSAAAIFGSAYVVTDRFGIARMPASANGYSGDHLAIATINGTSASVSFTLRNFGQATQFGPVSGSDQTARVLEGYPAQLRVQVLDAVGTPASGAVVTFTVPSSGASASLDRQTVTADFDGMVAVTGTANGEIGTFPVVASVPGATVPALFTLTNIPPAPTVTSLSPKGGIPSGGEQVTVTGMHFINVTGVTIGGVDVPTFTVNSPTSITLTTPPGSPGPAVLEITTPSGSTGTGTLFRYGPSPLVSLDVPAITLVMTQPAKPFTPVTVDYAFGTPTFSLSGGTLPAGLTFSSTTGEISGTPTEALPETIFTVTVTDQSVPTPSSASESFRLTVEPLSLNLTAGVDTSSCYSPFVAILKDQLGDPVQGVTVDFQPSRGVLSANAAVTDSTGTARVTLKSFTFQNYANTEDFYTGQYTNGATVNDLTVSVTVPGTGLSRTVSRRPCPSADQVEVRIVAGDNQTAAVDSVFPGMLEVEITKSYQSESSNYFFLPSAIIEVVSFTVRKSPVANARVVFEAPTSGPTAILGEIEVLTDANGIARVPVTAGSSGGTYGVTARIDAGTFGFTPLFPPEPVVFRLTNKAPVLPEISSIDPATGPSSGGTSVQLTGVGFTDATSVTIGGAPVTDLVVVDDTSITATTPAGTVGAASVVVTTPVGSNADNALYTYSKSPQVLAFDSVAPTPAIVGGNYTPTATGGGSTAPVVIAVSGSCSILDGVVTFDAVGDCTITADQAGDDNYDPAAQVQQVVSIGKAPQILTFTSAPPSPALFGGSYAPLVTGGASPMPVVLAVSGPCSLLEGVVTFDAVGDCTITADQAGDDNYDPAAQVQQVISIGKAPQVLTFTSTPPTPANVGGTYTPVVTGGGSSSVVEIAAAGACSIANGVVSFDAVGECIVTADQAGDDTHDAATQVRQSFDIAPANTRPIADAGPSQTVKTGETVVLDGSKSSDPDEDTLTYLWTQTDGTSVTLIDAASAMPSFVAPSLKVGDADVTLGFSLVVTDSRGLASEPSTVVITVLAPEPAADVLVRVNVSSDQALPADNQTEAEITVVLTDSDGNQLPFGQNTVDATTNLGTLRQGTAATVRQLNASPTGAHTFFLRSATPGVATVTVSVDGAEAAAVQVTFAMSAVPSISGETQGRIAGFMLGRADNLATNQPGLARFLTGSGCGFMNATLSDGSGSYDGCVARGNTWAEITSSRSDAGSYSLGTIGTHRMISPDLLIGVMVQFDTTDDRANSVSGTGWMLGPYFAAQLNGQPLFVEGRLLYGQSRNEIDPLGLYTDSFTTERLLAQLKATGEYRLPNVTLRPNLALSYAEDKQKAYVDSLLNVISGQKVSLLQIAAGLDFAMPVPVRTGSMELTGGVSGIYSESTAAAVRDARARVHLGLHYNNGKGTSIEFSGFGDGLGTSIRSYGANLSFQMQF